MQMADCQRLVSVTTKEKRKLNFQITIGFCFVHNHKQEISQPIDIRAAGKVENNDTEDAFVHVLTGSVTNCKNAISESIL